MTTNLSKKEWYALHGYDVHGEPKQRYVWEGAGTGPPIYGCKSPLLWLIDMQEIELRMNMRERNGGWVVDGLTGPVHGTQNVYVCDREDGYEHAIKKAYAMYLMTMGGHS